MRDGHCIEDRHGWNIINFKNPRHTFVSQHLRSVQATFHRYPRPNFDTLLIHQLSDAMTQGHFRGHFCNFLLRNWRNRQFIFFSKIYIYEAFQRYIVLPCFPLKWRTHEFYSGGHPRRSGVTLKGLAYIS